MVRPGSVTRSPLRWCILACAVLTGVVWLLGERLSGVELLPDQGASSYFWKPPDPTVWTSKDGEALAPVMIPRRVRRVQPLNHWYDTRMKRITVSLPEDLVDKIKRAAGGEGQVSSYVATALTDYQEREGLDEILASWQAETPIPDDARRQATAELDEVGLAHRPDGGDGMVG